jgi:hypothetical protein
MMPSKVCWPYLPVIAPILHTKYVNMIENTCTIYWQKQDQYEIHTTSAGHAICHHRQTTTPILAVFCELHVAMDL